MPSRRPVAIVPEIGLQTGQNRAVIVALVSPINDRPAIPLCLLAFSLGGTHIRNDGVRSSNLLSGTNFSIASTVDFGIMHGEFSSGDFDVASDFFPAAYRRWKRLSAGPYRKTI